MIEKIFHSFQPKLFQFPGAFRTDAFEKSQRCLQNAEAFFEGRFFVWVREGSIRQTLVRQVHEIR